MSVDGLPDRELLPHHVALVLDGNRREGVRQMSRRKGVPITQLSEEERFVAGMEGHDRGMEVFSTMSQYLLADVGIEYVSAYAFSTENWDRQPGEVSHVMSLVGVAMDRYLDDFDRRDIRLLHLGAEEGLPENALSAIRRGVERTKDNGGGVLAIALNYGGRQEVVEAARQAVKAALTSGVQIEQLLDSITENSLSGSIQHSEIPPVDLLIRTSGEQRTSGFHIWRGHYAELFFLDKNWPAVGTKDMDKALWEYAARQRRHGR